MAEPAPRYFSKSVGRALETLDAVRSAAGPVSLPELSAQLGLAPTALIRILHTLEAARYLETDGQGRYRVAPALGAIAPGRAQHLITTALPHLRELVREVRETGSLAIRFDHHIEVVAAVDSPQPIRMGNTVGRILPPHASSLGKAITALQPEDLRDALIRSYGLHRFTTHTIVDEVELRRELETIRERGFSTDVEESALGGCCFGAAIQAGRQVNAAISLSMPRMRLDGDGQRQELIGAVLRTAAAIARELQPFAPAAAVRPGPHEG